MEVACRVRYEPSFIFHPVANTALSQSSLFNSLSFPQSVRPCHISKFHRVWVWLQSLFSLPSFSLVSCSLYHLRHFLSVRPEAHTVARKQRRPLCETLTSQCIHTALCLLGEICKSARFWPWVRPLSLSLLPTSLVWSALVRLASRQAKSCLRFAELRCIKSVFLSTLEKFWSLFWPIVFFYPIPTFSSFSGYNIHVNTLILSIECLRSFLPHFPLCSSDWIITVGKFTDSSVTFNLLPSQPIQWFCHLCTFHY